MRVLLTTLSLLVLLALPAQSQSVGAAAPDFALFDLNNQTVRLSDLQGNVVVLFFLGYGCPFCIATTPNLNQNLYNNYSGNERFVMLGMDTWNGSFSQVTNFKSQTGALFNVLQKAGTYSSTVGITYDRLMVIDHQGIIRFKGARTAATDLNSAKAIIDTQLAIATAIDEETLPFQTTLEANYPNPFNPTTEIPFSLQRAGHITLSVYNMLGEEVTRLVDGVRPAGPQTATFAAQDLPSGIYLYRLTTPSTTLVKTMTLLK